MDSYEALIQELVRDCPGELLRLGPAHADRVAGGLQSEQGPYAAIVMELLLGRFQDPAAILRKTAQRLAENGVLVVAVASRRNPRLEGGFTRQELMTFFQVAGLDVRSCSLISDRSVPWFPIEIAPAPGRPRIDETEESIASMIVAIGHKRSQSAQLVSTIHAPAARTVATRALFWNRGARASSARYLAFVEGDSTNDGPWRDAAIRELQARSDLGAVGSQALGFGPLALPCQSLPYAVDAEGGADVSAVDGNGLIIERRKFVECGGFDDRLGPELDGADLSLRIRARGWRVATTRGGPSSTRASHSGARFFLHKWRGQVPPDPHPVPEWRVTRSSARPAPILWTGPLLERSGYGEEARRFVLGLDRKGVAVHINPTSWIGDPRLGSREASRLSALAVTEAPHRFINIVHSFPVARMFVGGSPGVFPLAEHFVPHPRALRNIGRTMYETDRILPAWAEYCNQMDEVWVPSKFNVESFAASGVERSRLRRVPGAVDTDLFQPGRTATAIPNASGFIFLSVFAWSLRKGWDALVRAYVEAFEGRQDVSLVLKVMPLWNQTNTHHHEQLREYIEGTLGLQLATAPRIIFMDQDVADADMPGLYAAADAFVLASRGEAYGRPFLEAMAMGLPTIGSRCGGNVDFMDETNSYLVASQPADVTQAGMREVPDYRGHRWLEPDVSDLKQAMRRVFEERDEARRRGSEARQRVVADHSEDHVAGAVLDRLEAQGVKAKRGPIRRVPALTWEGPLNLTFGMAEVNREMTKALARTRAVDVKPSEALDWRPWLTGRSPDVTVRHQWPPNLARAGQGRVVTYQPWEYGSIPADWVEPMNTLMDEVWVPSTYVRDCFIRSGIDRDRVHVVPYGIDPVRFRPDALPIRLSTNKSTRFLFVGGAIPRKGIDTLLDAYTGTFSRDEDVCLVIKGLGASTFYRGQAMERRIRMLSADASKPEIVYFESEVPASEMPGLFKACTCLVHPYRGEGFGLPILEAMACGLPVIVPDHGACLDFCDDTVAYLVPAHEVRLPDARVGDMPTVERGWWAEVESQALGATMRRVLDNPRAAASLGQRASDRVRVKFTWAAAAQIAIRRLSALARG